jgi:hypothetical protein
MIAKALLYADQPEAALRSADRCLAVCRDHGLTDFDLAYAHERRWPPNLDLTVILI